jgi:hypothetical protein
MDGVFDRAEFGREPSGRALRRKQNSAAVWVIRSQQTAEPDISRGFLRKPHEGTFRMVAVWAFEGPLSVLRAMRLATRRHHHSPALWARRPFSRDRSWGCEPETEHVIFLSRTGALPLWCLRRSPSDFSPMRREERAMAPSMHSPVTAAPRNHSLPPVLAGIVAMRVELAGPPCLRPRLYAARERHRVGPG